MSGSYTGIEYYFDPTVPDLPVVDPTHYLHAILAGDLSLIFYLAVILIGSTVPLVIALVMTRRKNAQTALASSAKSLNAVTAASIALMCAIAGGVVWRCILYWVGLQTFPYFSL
jgi:anaerobic dimethyl sulfoxide reductase subunit C (anchor subunit)